MKKVSLLLFSIIILMVGCSNKLTTYKEINYKKLNEMFANKEDFILYVGSSECPKCALYTMALKRVIKKYQVEVYYIDIYKLNVEEQDELADKFNLDGVPMTLFIVDGEEKTPSNRIRGNQTYDKIVASFKKNNYIK
ncbi:MAG: thioredoxin family protein [Mollicutes bacterium]|nr:thioredoxin family protein [Mollicutes bacterium]